MRFYNILPVGILLLTACGGSSSDTTPPHIDKVLVPSVISPRVNVEIQARDDQQLSRVRLYAKLKGADVLLGEAKTAPYIINPDTSRLPNQIDITVYAEAVDAAGNHAVSANIQTRIADDYAPALAYYAGFTYPATAITAQSLSMESRQNDLFPEMVKPPLDTRNFQPAKVRQLRAEASRVRAVEWGWMPVASALGYNLYRSQDLIGTYIRTRGIQPAQGSPLIRQAEFLAGDDANQPSFGLYSTLLSGGESPYSNVNQAQFLPEQELVSPTEGESVIGGRPTLTWLDNPSKDVTGYLFFVYTQNPEQVHTTPVWASIDGKTTAKTTAVYSGALNSLVPGTYYWRVAAVSFNSQNVANGFSYSEVRTFNVKP